MRIILIRIGIVVLVALAVLQGVMAGRDVGHREGEKSPLDKTSAPTAADQTPTPPPTSGT